MTPTEALFEAAGRLDADARLGREPSSVAILQGTAAIAQPVPPDARDAARRHLATAGYLRAWAVHEDADRAAALEDRALAQEILAGIALVSLPRLAA